jgi:asparagine synthase (glutamine-hydrolysing)
MRGIAGLSERDPARTPDEAVLRRMSAAQRHRGPEREGIERGPGFGFVARGASDEAEGPARPFVTSDGAVVVACDGAIYNAPELRAELARDGARLATPGPLETLAELYRRRGPDFLHALRGMFALAVWDARERRLLLARDRLGTKPFVWAETPEGLAFASECKAILSSGRVDAALDPAAIDWLFRIEYVVSPRTAFDGVRSLLPGHRLLYSAGAVRIERWWDVPFPAGGRRPRRDAGEWVEGLQERMVDAVRVQSRAARPVSVWLSGGLDSSAIAALVARDRGAPLDVHILGHEDPTLDERADTLVDLGDLPLRPHRGTMRDADFAEYPRAMWHAESPTSSGVETAWWILSRSAAASPLVLSGQGVGVVLAEKWIYRFEEWTRRLARLPRGVRRLALVGPLSPRRRPWGAGAILAPREPVLERFAAMTGPRDAARRGRIFSGSLRERIAAARRNGAGADPLPQLPPGDPFDRLHWVDIKTNLVDFVQQKMERVAMGCGIEVRVPFLDHQFVEYAALVPPALLRRGPLEKWILREALKGILPEPLRLRPKRGLRAPYARWLREPLPEFAAELLSPGAIRAKGYFDPTEVGRRLERHRAGVEDARDSLFAVLAVHVLDELFVARARPWDGPPS